jgi:hypothetical protein
MKTRMKDKDGNDVLLWGLPVYIVDRLSEKTDMDMWIPESMRAGMFMEQPIQGTLFKKYKGYQIRVKAEYYDDVGYLAYWNDECKGTFRSKEICEQWIDEQTKDF